MNPAAAEIGEEVIALRARGKCQFRWIVERTPRDRTAVRVVGPVGIGIHRLLEPRITGWVFRDRPARVPAGNTTNDLLPVVLSDIVDEILAGTGLDSRRERIAQPQRP